MKIFAWIGLVGLALLATCTSPAAPGGILLTGVWGSDQGRLTATQVSTQFTGPCGSGNSSDPIMLDKHGSFDIEGLYGASGTAARPARFRGAVASKKLQLRVVMADSTEAVGPIMLDLGQQPALATCH